MFSDRQIRPNSVDSDQKLQNAASDQNLYYTVYHAYDNV